MPDASALLDQWATIAARDGVSCGGYGVRVTPQGGLQTGTTTNLDREDAIRMINTGRDQSAAQAPAPTPKPTVAKAAPGPLTWDRLNEATQAFFYELVDGLPDGEWTGPLPKVTLQVAPRLTMLKRAGVLTTEGKRTKTLIITAEGQRVHALAEVAA